MADYEDLLEQVREILGPLTKAHVEMTEETDLVADLGLDSLKVMDLLTEVEDRFDVSIPLNLLPEIRTLGDLTAQLQTLVDEG
ncbi:MAG: acyl carrier protein [Deferrisomatales bacterium]